MDSWSVVCARRANRASTEEIGILMSTSFYSAGYVFEFDRTVATIFLFQTVLPAMFSQIFPGRCHIRRGIEIYPYFREDTRFSVLNGLSHQPLGAQIRFRVSSRAMMRIR
jgi:hypothetical protein